MARSFWLNPEGKSSGFFGADYLFAVFSGLLVSSVEKEFSDTGFI